jgi:hypothetical protein
VESFAATMEEMSANGTELKKIKLLLADVIDELAASEAKVTELSFLLSVLKEASQSCIPGGRLEAEHKRIQRAFADRSQSAIQPGPKLAALLQIAQELRREDR